MTEVRGGGWAVVRYWTELGLLTLLVAAAAFTAGDWALWKLRGSQVSTVVVTRMVVAPLKGNREEYYADGMDTVSCSRSVLPWGGMDACWWQQRRRVVLER